MEMMEISEESSISINIKDVFSVTTTSSMNTFEIIDKQDNEIYIDKRYIVHLKNALDRIETHLRNNGYKNLAK